MATMARLDKKGETIIRVAVLTANGGQDERHSQDGARRTSIPRRSTARIILALLRIYGLLD